MSDPNTRTRNRQVAVMGGGLAVVLAVTAAGMFLFDSSDAPTVVGRKLQTVQITQPGTVTDKDEWRAQQAQKEKSNETLIGELRASVKQQTEESKRLEKELRKELDEVKASKSMGRSTDSSVLNTPLPLVEPTGRSPAGNFSQGQRTLNPPNLQYPPYPALPTGQGRGATLLNQPVNQALGQGTSPVPGTNVAQGTLSGGVVDAPVREVEIIQFSRTAAKGSGVGGAPTGPNSADPVVLGFPVSEKAKQFSQPKSEGAGGEFITAGSFVRVAMLNGIDAPTGGQAQGNPLPVAFHVLDVANLPNKYRLDVKDCRVIGAAWGDLSSERTMIRTESMSCVLGDGQTIEMQVKGQAIGEDGKAGLRSRLVSKQGAMLANALFGGALSGIGKAFQQASTTTMSSALGTTQTIDPNQVSRAALGSGLGTAGNLLAEYYLKAADKLFPVLETDGGRVIELLITKGVSYPGKASPNSNNNYRALLSRGSTSGGNSDDE